MGQKKTVVYLPRERADKLLLDTHPLLAPPTHSARIEMIRVLIVGLWSIRCYSLRKHEAGDCSSRWILHLFK